MLDQHGEMQKAINKHKSDLSEANILKHKIEFDHNQEAQGLIAEHTQQQTDQQTRFERSITLHRGWFLSNLSKKREDFQAERNGILTISSPGYNNSTLAT